EDGLRDFHVTGVQTCALPILWEFLTDDPREANTEGGIFPAIFGTVTMVLLMSVIVTPFGILAAIYLREYARQGLMTRIMRISVRSEARRAGEGGCREWKRDAQ